MFVAIKGNVNYAHNCKNKIQWQYFARPQDGDMTT